MTKEEVLEIIKKGLGENSEYTAEDIWYKIIGIYLRETSNSKFKE